MEGPSVSSLLLKYLSAPEPERFSTNGEYLHVTDLFTACLRQVFFARKTGTVILRHFSPGTKMNFRQGLAMEAELREELWKMGILAEKRPELVNRDLKITGSPDGRLLNGELVEMKTMDPSVFKFTATNPLPQHSYQMKSYLWMDGVRPRGRLVSITWGREKVPARDQLISYDVRVGEIIKREVSKLREAEAGGPLPDRICKEETEPRAILCPFTRECFAQKAGITKTISEQLRA